MQKSLSADVVPDEDSLDEGPLPDGEDGDGETARAELEVQKQLD